MKPTVEIDSASGFCFGVVTAIKKAEEELSKTGRLYCLGDIVHNSDEVERLREKGLITISHEELKNLHDVKVLLRAHGEPPSTYETARNNNIEIIDATCPVVLQLQRRIKKSHDEGLTQDSAPQIVIYGKKGHAEVNGLVGQTDGSAIVIEDSSELDKIDYDKPVILYSQTTKSVEGFKDIIEQIESKKRKDVTFRSYDTICRHVANRVENLKDFAKNHDLILFVSSSMSSNGKYLFSECMAANNETKLISNETDLKPGWFKSKKSIGICGATSTPRWLMEKIKERSLRFIQCLIAIIVLSAGITSCGPGRHAVSRGKDYDKTKEITLSENRNQREKKEKTEINGDVRQLVNYAKTWLGTPYKYGGHSRSGTDCSGFVMEVYSATYNLKLPRQSGEQASYCKKINFDSLAPGDLIFFSSGSKSPVSHVGIYIGNDEMIHASISQGVTISNVYENYYQQHFHSCGRIEAINISGKEQIGSSQSQTKPQMSSPPKNVKTVRLEDLNDMLTDKTDSILSKFMD